MVQQDGTKVEEVLYLWSAGRTILGQDQTWEETLTSHEYIGVRQDCLAKVIICQFDTQKYA